jgi:hypothetical protein
MTKMFSTITVHGLLMLPAAYAQSEQPIQANVPFAFRASKATLAAGSYQLTYNTSAHTLMIRGLDQNSEAAFATAAPMTGSGPRGESGKLVFDCYEKTCYLARVWQGRIGSGRGLKVPHPKPEREVVLATRMVTITVPAE